MYIYDALCCASPILRAFTKKGAKAVPYPKEPYAITKHQAKENEEMREKRVMEKGKAMMAAFMAQCQRRQENHAAEEVILDGDDD